MSLRESSPRPAVFLLAIALLAWAPAAATAGAVIPANKKEGGGMVPIADLSRIPAPPFPIVPMPYPNSADTSSTKTIASKVKFGHKPLTVADVPKMTAQMEEDVAAVGEALQAWKAVSHKLNDEQRARLEATIKMYDASKDSLVAMVALRARLQVDVGVMRQLGEDVPKVTAAMDTALEFALEKVDDFAKRRDKGEDAGLPERIAITILENVQDAFGNLKKDTEKILNDAKRTPKHYQDEFRRLNDNLAAACAGFEDTASQAGALHASNLKAAKSYGDEQGVIKAGLMSQTNMVNIKFKKVVRVNISYGHNGSSRVGELAVQASRTTIIIK